MFWLPWAQDYRTVEQPRVYLLHCCGIASLILPSRETYREETKAMLPHSPGDFSIDVEQFFSITIAFKSMSYSVFAVAWPDETILLSKLRDPLLCSSNFLIWAGYKGISLPLLSFFAGNDLLKSLVKHPSGVLPSPVWCFSFTNLGKLIPLSMWAATLFSCILNPNSAQSSLHFSALNSFLYCLFLLPGTTRLVWLGFG